MPRKKSRPTHRENAAAVPSNEGGFYKMFWNSMDTNPGTNGTNSPSQGEVPVTSPPVIISDSEGSPCAHDENSCENRVVPLPIKEEIREDTVMSPNQHSSAETSSNFQESHSATNGEDSSHQTCLPGNPLTSPSNNSPPSPSLHTDLISPQSPPHTCEYSNSISTCVDSTVSEISSHEPPTEVPVASGQPQETPCRAEEDGGPMTVEDTQVCCEVTTEERVEVVPESNFQIQPNFSEVENSTVSEETSCNDNVISNQTKNVFEDSDDTAVDQNIIYHASPVREGILAVTPTHGFDPPEEPDAAFSESQSMECVSGTTNNENLQEMSEEKPMELDSEPQTPAVGQVNCETTPHELPSLILLRSLLNARDEDLEDLNLDEALAELPGLIGDNDPPEQNSQNEGEMVCFESGQESGLPIDINVSGMDVDQNTTFPENIPSTENMTPDVSEPNQSNEMTVEKDDEFPIFNNFLPKKIKLDAIGILRSVKVLKDSVRSLYKEYLKEDVILRTVSTSEPPAEKDDASADEVEETPSFPPVNVYPKICCVKMERLPDPFVKKSTITMSDDTFKTWKKQIIRQRNEEKFRYLKVWRRGRTLLWRECELAGMDRATYDEQVAYVKKHKLNENSSSDSGSSDDESEGGASDRNCDSSEESYSDLENEDSEGELSSFPSLASPTKQTNSENQSLSSLHMTSGTPTEVRLSEDEYVIERTSSTNQSSENKAPSALKITIRKASTSKSEEDREKPEEENFPVPVQPTVKSRKIATKRTYRRPSDPIPKATVLPKLSAADTKKSKNIPVEDEYDQSLLGTRSYEVENFNLLEKWDIPFEEPTLFRSPRAASKLAQLKTKEAFLPHKKHAPVKPAVTSSSSSTTFTTTPTTATDVTTNTVSKAVRDVVEMLCAKTVEAMLFPESKSAGTKKPTETDVDAVYLKDSTTQMQPSGGPAKSSVPSEETSSIFDESSEMEMSQSETNSTLDASSDFGGSTASLASEDFPAPQNKSPKKPRRRRPRFGPAWGKKKKVKTKAANEQPFEKHNSKEDERSVNDANESRVHSTEKPVVENVQVKGKSTQEVGASPVHSTQVPVVSEGPGQSPYESEDDSAHRLKGPLSRNDSDRKTSESSKETQPKDVIRSGEAPLEEPKPNKKVQEEVVPRLTRSKQPTVELDPELLENFGTRKRKPRTHVVEDVSQGEDGKKSKLDVTKNTPQKSKAQTVKPSIIDSKETSSPLDKVVDDDSNTQVPEVSEGPGDVGLDHESKPDQLNKAEVNVMMLRSRSRGPGPRPTESAISPVKHSTDDNQKTDKTSKAEEDDPADKNQSEEPLVLESPASPPPETVEPEISSRITRSKRRSGPAYVAVKSTAANALPSVCDIVDSIARHRLPTPSKLFDAFTPLKSSQSNEPGMTPNVDPTPVNDGKVLTSSSSELGPQPKVVHSDSLGDKSVQPPTIKGTCQGSTLEQPVNLLDSDESNIVPATKIMDSEGSSIVPVPKSVTNTSLEIADKTSKLSNNLIGADAPCGLTDENKSPAAVEVGLGTVAVEEDTSSGIGSPSSGLAVEKPVTEEVECGRLEVLDTLNSILAVTSPKKKRYKVSTAGPLLPPPLNSSNLQTTTVMNASILQPPVSNISAIPTINSTPLPGYLSGTQDMNNILPGTFLNSFLNSTLDANLTTFSNETNDSASLADDPDGDLVIDEGEVPDVNFWENLTNADLDKNDNSADFSDDDNNSDLADKIDQIVKDQIHQDPVPVPSLKSKEASASLGDGSQKVLDETSPSKSVLNRRDSIDERTGLPTNFIQRLRDPRIRSRLLSQLEEEEATGKTQSALAPLLNSLPASNLTSSTVAVPQANEVGINDPRRRADEVAVVSSSSSTGIPCMNVQVITQPVMGAQFETVSLTMPGQPTTLVLPITPTLATPLVASGTLVAQGTTVLPVEDSGKPEEPPDPSKVDFVVPPSDDEEEETESIKRRPKKAKKQVDVELMYKSPLEDLQSEARPGYGERAPRRYADNFPRRRSGDDRLARWDDGRGRDDRRFEDRGRSQSRDRRFEDRGRSQSRDRRFEDRGRSRSRDRRFEDRGRSRSRDGRFDDRGRDRSRSRDRRAFYDRPRDQSRDRRAYDPYPGREDPESTPHHMDHMQVPYNQSPWPVSPALHNHQMVMPSPRWQPNYYPEPHVPHPPIFVPEPPKIDFMETRLINLELLPKTTNLEISPIRKVFSYFDKDSVQVMNIPPPTYDPNDQPHTIKMMDPVTEEMVDFIQTPRPTSGLTKDIFKHVPPHLNLDDVVKFHFIHPSYVMVQDNDEDPLSSSDEEEDKLEAKENTPSHDREQDSKPLQHKKRVSKPLLEHHQKQQRKPADEQLQKEGGELSLQHHSKGEHELISGNRLNQENTPKIVREDTPLQNLLQNLPLLQQFSLHRFQPPIPTPPPAPEWNDVDLRMSRELALEEVPLLERSPSPLKERSRKRSRSRSKSPKSTSLKSPSESSRSTSRRSRSKSPRSTRLKSPSESSRSTSRRSRSKTPRSTSHRSRSRSPRSTSRRSRSKSPRSTSHRSRSRSPRSTSRRSRSKSPRSTSHRSRRSSPRRRRSRSRSRSLSDMSISPARSRSRSPSYSGRGSRTSRRRRSRSRSSERSRTSRSKRSRSPKRHSTSISPSRKHRR